MIIETKGRVWEGTEVKDEAISDWCARVSEASKTNWRCARVDQSDSERANPKRLSEILAEAGS